MAGPITQREIAGRLGVSQALVSRALGETHAAIQASPETVRRIRAAATRWGYRPSAAAQTLRGAPSRVLGVVVKRFQDPFFGGLVAELQSQAAARQHSLALTGADSDLALLDRQQPDALILVGSDFMPPGLAERARRDQRPLVRLGSADDGDGACPICIDQEAGFADLVALLRGLGHVRVGFLGDGAPVNRRRAAALTRALATAGLPVTRSHCVHVEGASDASMAAALERLRKGGPDRSPTAIVAADDETALLALRALHDAGLHVPRDMSIAGMDDIPFARLSVPALTTLRPDIPAMVASTLDFALAPAGAGAAYHARAIRPALMVRESCAAPCRAAHAKESRS